MPSDLRTAADTTEKLLECCTGAATAAERRRRVRRTSRVEAGPRGCTPAQQLLDALACMLLRHARWPGRASGGGRWRHA